MTALDASFVQSHMPAFEDFWNRHLGDSFFELGYPAFGYTVHLTTNSSHVLDAARLASPRYARSEALAPPPAIELGVMVVPTWSAAPVPADLPARIQTIGYNDSLFQAATPWVQWTVDLQARRALGFVSPALAAEPRIVSRYLLDRAVNNVLLREGVGQLHATSLMGKDHAVIFIAPHGTGKSTTAFHLLSAGYRLMGDGLLFIRERAGQFELMGYPVGEAKLTPEMQSLFPEWRGEGDEVTVHNVLKHIVNLRALAPDKLIERAVFPERIVICLAERNGEIHTGPERLSAKAAMERMLPDTIFRDEVPAMARSLEVICQLAQRATCYRLTLGTDRTELVETIVQLAEHD